jgi:formylglycine-generating enzyme required for sulfatase activity
MHGNVVEWCWDWYKTDYYSEDVQWSDPVGPDNGDNRVVRGGGWNNHANMLRSAQRYNHSPSAQYTSLGFRLAHNSGEGN